MVGVVVGADLDVAELGLVADYHLGRLAVCRRCWRVVKSEGVVVVVVAVSTATNRDLNHSAVLEADIEASVPTRAASVQAVPDDRLSSLPVWPAEQLVEFVAR